jgi:NAD-dependent SIR2 family protein deacetylase
MLPDQSARVDARAASATVYFLGAGASAAATGVPVLTATLLADALDRPPAATPPAVVATVRRLATDLGVEDAIPAIDDLLAVIDVAIDNGLALSRSWGIEALRAARRSVVQLTYDFVNERIHQKRTSLGPLASLIHSWDRARPRAVVTLNWDCLLEQAFQEIAARQGLIDYGIAFNHYNGARQPADPGSLLVLKPHGSLSWGHCPLCGQLVSFLTSDTYSLTARWTCDTCSGAHLEPVLLPPVFTRTAQPWFLQQVWELAEAALRNCDRLVFIGYSFPSQDVDVRVHLIRGLSQRMRPGPLTIEVVDLLAGDAANDENRFKSILGGAHGAAPIRFFHAGFDAWIGAAV